MRVLVDKKLSMTQQCTLAAQEANCGLGCIKSSKVSRLREGILPFSSALSHFQYHKDEKRAGAPLLSRKGARVAAVSPEERRLHRELIGAFQCLKGATRESDRDF